MNRSGAHRVQLLAIALTLGSAGPVLASPVSCTVSVSEIVNVRAEGVTEPIGDLMLTCTGGTPTADGAPVPRVNVAVFLNAMPTSRVLAAPWAEPLLMVDEPAPATQLSCPSPDGLCTTLGTGTGIGVYDGSAGRPNVFQAQQSGNSIAWPGVPFDPPGDGGARLLRLTNIRVNAAGLAASATTPPPVAALVTTSGDISLPVVNPNQTVGTILPSLAVSIRDALSLAPLTGVIALPRCNGASQLRIATIRFTEQFPGAFRKRAAATTFATPLAVASQNVPGAASTTETGFLNTSLVGHPVRGPLNTAGLTDFGTRLKAAFGNVPAGVSLFVDAAGASLLGVPDNTARVTASESSGFTPVSEAAGLPGTAPIALHDGVGGAVWEITDSDPLATNSIEFGVYVSYSGDLFNGPALGTASIAASLSPAGAASALGGPIPRFAPGPAPASFFSITECGGAPALAAAILPSSRSVKIGTSATVFATVINTGTDNAIGCRITPINTMPAAFAARTADETNAIVGTPPVDIPIGTSQSFVLALKPTGAITPVDVQFSFDCANSEPAPIIPGLNTVLFSAASAAVPDVVALAATDSGDGVVTLLGETGMAAFAVATVNVGAAGSITVSADTGPTVLPVKTSVCRTEPETGACMHTPAPTVTTTVAANATPTFAVFVMGSGTVPFNPATNRVFVRFKDTPGATRGATSVAIRTQ